MGFLNIQYKLILLILCCQLNRRNYCNFFVHFHRIPQLYMYIYNNARASQSFRIKSYAAYPFKHISVKIFFYSAKYMGFLTLLLVTRLKL